MRIAFRTDASLQIGTGHVMRCLTLADALREQGAQCTFVCRPHAGHLLDLISERGHNVLALPESGAATPNTNGTFHADWLGVDWATDAAETQQILSSMMPGELLDWLVVDHYALEQRWEQILSTNAKRIMVIDDLADRHHDCDLLLDQNLGRSAKDYGDLLEHDAHALIGPRYALLRPEFSQWRSHSLARRGKGEFKKLLISMGGVDKDNATGQVLDALKICKLPSELNITVVMGATAPWVEQVKGQAARMPWPTKVLVGVNNIAQLMTESDLAIGAAGSTSWERCCLGLPALILVLADNQLEAATALVATQSAWMLRHIDELPESFNSFFTEGFSLDLMAASEAASCICDGEGWKRVSALLVN